MVDAFLKGQYKAESKHDKALSLNYSSQHTRQTNELKSIKDEALVYPFGIKKSSVL